VGIAMEQRVKSRLDQRSGGDTTTECGTESCWPNSFQDPRSCDGLAAPDPGDHGGPISQRRLGPAHLAAINRHLLTGRPTANWAPVRWRARAGAAHIW
jgi:hypothetical protein